MFKKIIGCAVAVLLALAVVRDPSGAAAATRHFGAWVGSGVLAFGDYLATLITGKG